MTAIPQSFLTEASRYGLSQGIRVLQGYRLADTDEGHVDRLLEFMAPKPNTRWADVGCGFGEVARLMHRQRPDLDFVCINNNAFQLSHAPKMFPIIACDMHDIPLDDACVDGCMFLYSLCHARHADALAEAARITRPGGYLFVFDYVRLSGDDLLMQRRLYATALRLERLVPMAECAGWDVVKMVTPDGDDRLFRALYGNDAEYAAIFDKLEPLLWKAVRL